ncbi:hypothetical protein VTJ49DRAFT_736 [Mycothermus thermophilus]|uniref:Uncharacterized protein n=1 Tax=Humicola insolens TaxID=85995 RepID=A0ABR3VEB7_HUMIN
MVIVRESIAVDWWPWLHANGVGLVGTESNASVLVCRSWCGDVSCVCRQLSVVVAAAAACSLLSFFCLSSLPRLHLPCLLAFIPLFSFPRRVSSWCRAETGLDGLELTSKSGMVQGDGGGYRRGGNLPRYPQRLTPGLPSLSGRVLLLYSAVS